MANTLNVSAVPAKILISNGTSEDKNITLYPDNADFLIPAGDSIVLKVATSREWLYYYKTSTEIGLTISEVEDPEDDGGNEG